MLAELGVDFYRFSISWSRILPKGFGEINQDGIDYYNNLIDELLKQNVQPLVTLFHWDTPQILQDLGGWTNPIIVDYFEDYARIVFESFGDRVKDWITFNEPYNMCLNGYGTRTFFVVFAPDLGVHGIGEYECTHNVIKAHARAYHLYNDTFKATQKGISYCFYMKNISLIILCVQEK
jgi:beta-glucosidase/6-phospho-beta-glucosidase/beta-galactosidase